MCAACEKGEEASSAISACSACVRRVVYTGCAAPEPIRKRDSHSGSAADYQGLADSIAAPRTRGGRPQSAKSNKNPETCSKDAVANVFSCANQRRNGIWPERKSLTDRVVVFRADRNSTLVSAATAANRAADRCSATAAPIGQVRCTVAARHMTSAGSTP
ncbi:hypothetical protein MRX96_031522 [Rhipicephalus microplus]